MSGHRLEMADVFREYGTAYEEAYGSSTSAQQRKVMLDLSACRTSVLGGHKKKCDRCGHEQNYYNSCRNRHCPKCQASARAGWLEARVKDLLDVAYFHVVFTIPDKIGQLALQNKRLVYSILFRSAAETLLTIAGDPKHLGANIGFLTVLHTWSQNLLHHPHIHCVVPGGGICPKSGEWIPCRENFFLPVRVLSRVFRGKFLCYLQQAYDSGKISFYGNLQDLSEKQRWNRWKRRLWSKEWVVYAKEPFGGPKQVLKYLARYTHRVAISNQRILSLEDGKVTFRWKDYAKGNIVRTMSLNAVEFCRRFLLHVLPTGFVRIRYYGFLSNGQRRKQLTHIRNLLGDTLSTQLANGDVSSSLSPSTPDEHDEPELCPKCKKGRFVRVERIEPVFQSRSPPWATGTL